MFKSCCPPRYFSPSHTCLGALGFGVRPKPMDLPVDDFATFLDTFRRVHFRSCDDGTLVVVDAVVLHDSPADVAVCDMDLCAS